jgi:MinD superfamily P-loop ATPase
MGGKGGVGKTGLMVALAEWFEANEIPRPVEEVLQ